MKKYLILALMFILGSCLVKDNKKSSAQQIVDKAIEVSGGERYHNSNISFKFRKNTYEIERIDNKKYLKRISVKDSAVILDVLSAQGLRRYRNDSLVVLHDTTANKYASSINSVHYFAYLPYGLNDRAVRKEYLGQVGINGNEYHKIRVTFEEQGGGEDFEDVYIYWFNTDTLKPDFLAYEFHVDGGGMRFREAFNERYVGGIRFVDYNNYRPLAPIDISDIDSFFGTDKLQLFSKIELTDIAVSPDSYN